VFELEDEIQTFNYIPLVKVKSFDGMLRTVEDDDAEDSYTDSLEEGDYERDLEYEYSDVEGENENTIVQKEINWRNEWDKIYKWDDNKKEFNSGRKRIQIGLYFKPEKFDETEDYEK
jgi:hypothetical protein